MKVFFADYAILARFLFLFLVVHNLLEQRGERVHAHRAKIAVRAVARRHGAVLHVAVANDHHVGHLLHLRVADLAADLLVAVVDLHAEARVFERSRLLGAVVGGAVGDRQEKCGG